MSKTAAKKAPAQKTPAKKIDLMKYLPAIILLIGLIIMTVCFFHINGKLNAANEQLAQAQAALITVQGETEGDAAAVTDLSAEITRLQADLEDTAEALAEKTALNELNEAEIARLEAVVAEQQVQLDIANTALIEAMEYLSMIGQEAE